MPVQESVAMSLHKLGGGDGLINIRILYSVHKSTGRSLQSS